MKPETDSTAEAKEGAPEAESAADRLAQAFGEQAVRLPESAGMPVFRVEPANLIGVAERLKGLGFNMCLDVGGVDYHPRVPRFEVVYHFLALPAHRRVRLRVPVPEEHPIVPTISHLWPSANWAEREVYDLFGIRFEGHPNLQRIVLPADWQGHPLRKDYPLRGPRAAEAEKLPAGERWDPLGARITPNKVRRPGAQGAAGALDAGGGRSKG